ncbi:hypothetical protein [Leptothrix ochracea]|uniref:hypothetical protein n=1 Tax=Leptothrix ochracea TaxID=735331 RepID=UPI0034E241E5
MKYLPILLLFYAISAHSSEWKFLSARDSESVIYFIDINQKNGTHTLAWVKTIFTVPKSLAIAGEERKIVKDHSKTVSGWDVDCNERTGKLVYYQATTSYGDPIDGYTSKGFAIDFLGSKASAIQIMNIGDYKRLDGILKNAIIDLSCR